MISVLLLTLDLPKVQGLEFYLNAEKLMDASGVISLMLSCLFQNPVYCSLVSVEVRRWFLYA